MAKNVCKALKALGMDPRRIENSVGTGTPDMNCTAGWLELKHLDRWPMRASTVVKMKRFTDDQRRWMLRRWGANRGAWLLLQVGCDWLLFTGEAAYYHVGDTTQQELRDHALATWTGNQELGENLVRCLSEPRN